MSPLSRTDQMFALRLQGQSYAAIAKRFGVSRQRIQEILRPPTAVHTAVMNRAYGKCQDCGLAITSGHVHHVKVTTMTRDSYNDLANLRYLCPNCHRIAHGGGLTPEQTRQMNKTYGLLDD